LAGFEVTPVGRFSTDPRGRKNTLYLFKGSTLVVHEDENIRFANPKNHARPLRFGALNFAMSNSSTPTISS
jgi:hypothetical protein